MSLLLVILCILSEEIGKLSKGFTHWAFSVPNLLTPHDQGIGMVGRGKEMSKAQVCRGGCVFGLELHEMGLSVKARFWVVPCSPGVSVQMN